MKLKVKSSGLSAGRPIAIINEIDAKILGVRVDERIIINSKHGKLISLFDLSSNIAEKGHIVLSKEIIDFLRIKNNEFVEISLAKATQSANQIINKKLLREKLNEKEIYQIVKDIVDNALPETEIAFFISAIYERGMDINEITWLTKAVFNTGKKLNLNLKNKLIVDKHSIGGIAGNRTTPIVVPICAAAGLIMPKTSSRAITSAAGTADVMEAICKVNLTKEEIEKIVRKTNACMVWGGALGFAPADDKIIRVENLISIDPEPNLIASILAKKLSVGSKYVLIDIPYGKYAKVNKKQAIKLKNKFETIGKRFNLKIKCVITNGSQPIGHGIGPIPELRDIISILKNQPEHPKDLRKKAVFLAGEILELCNKAKKGKGYKMAEEVLVSGKAFDKFKEIVEAQKGNLSKNKLMLAKFSHIIYSEKNAKIVDIDNKRINLLARVAGSPNDKKAGLYLWKHLGEKIKKGEEILTIYSSSDKKLKDAVDFYKKNKVIIVR